MKHRLAWAALGLPLVIHWFSSNEKTIIAFPSDKGKTTAPRALIKSRLTPVHQTMSLGQTGLESPRRIDAGRENSDCKVAWIKSSECPYDHFSIVHFSDEGRVLKEVDCRKTDLTELTSLSGEQGNVVDVPAEQFALNLAISGGGYFLLQCPDTQLILTRDGGFRMGPGDRWLSENGCVLLNTQGLPFQSADVLPNGCAAGGECLATLDPYLDEVHGLRYINSFSFRAGAAILPDLSVSRNGPTSNRPRFFVNAREEVHNAERSSTGISWGSYPRVDLDKVDCL